MDAQRAEMDVARDGGEIDPGEIDFSRRGGMGGRYGGITWRR